MNNYLDLLKLVLSKMQVKYFDLIKSTKQNGVMHLYFEKRNTIPKEEFSLTLITCEFHKEVTMQRLIRTNNLLRIRICNKREIHWG